MKRWIALPLVVAALSACGGGGSSVSHPSVSGGAVPVAAATGTANVNVAMRIPAATATSTKRSPAYVSAGTASVKLAVSVGSNTPVTQTFAVTPGSGSCPTTSGTTTCTFALQVPTGAPSASASLAVTTYDATMNVLATGTVPFTLDASGTNTVGITLDGVPAFLTIALPSATAGTAYATPQAVSVTVSDADHYAIVGSYATPVTLFDDDTSGATTLTTSGSENPPAHELLSSSDVATLAYTGLAIAPTMIGAVAARATAGFATFAPALQPIVVTTSDTLNPSYAGIDLYATTGTGSQASVTISEAGWTNSPYSHALTVTPGGSCGSIATYTQSGNTITASAAAGASPGTCTGFTLSDPFGQSQSVAFAYTTFSYTGADQSITVPAGVTTATMSAWGSPGGMAADGVPGGAGAYVSGEVNITAGASLKVTVGGNLPISTATYGGGGLGGSSNGNPGEYGGSGGGLSGVSSGPTLLVIAGGGGGGGYLGAQGGAAGFNSGSNGGTTPASAGGGGVGAQQYSPGAGGTPGTGAVCPGSDVCVAGSPGSSSGVGGGGNGGSSSTSAGGGGGGNGAYGGGGGASGAGGGGGGGGSSLVYGQGAGQISSLSVGQVTIKW